MFRLCMGGCCIWFAHGSVLYIVCTRGVAICCLYTKGAICRLYPGVCYISLVHGSVLHTFRTRECAIYRL